MGSILSIYQFILPFALLQKSGYHPAVNMIKISAVKDISQYIISKTACKFIFGNFQN